MSWVLAGETARPHGMHSLANRPPPPDHRHRRTTRHRTPPHTAVPVGHVLPHRPRRPLPSGPGDSPRRNLGRAGAASLGLELTETTSYGAAGYTWAKTESLIPEPARCGDTWRNNDLRPLVETIIWKLRTGAPWEDIHVAHGSDGTVYSWYSQWEKDGVWARVEPAITVRGNRKPASERA